MAAADAAAIAASTRFKVNWFVGRGPNDGPVVDRNKIWDRSPELATLDEARTARDARGKDEYGRRGMIYAITKTNATLFVE